ncbi:hypothetical protein PG997_004358 [Apiospora hydei]|uniref:Mitochondrial import inner membrane translocase subunit tim23 n=1 Tax=Apiospora hydei TaxID=1337664 RepID=A0ABR1X1W6_9PEZI
MSIWDLLTGRKSSSEQQPPSPTSTDTAPTTTFTPPPFNPTEADGESLEYLTLEDSALTDLPGAQTAIPSRGFSDDLCYGTAPKLRLNSVLNAVTRRGPFLGNSAGVVAITYNCFNSGIGYFRGKHDSANTVAAGALSGMLFKSTKGLRPMMISGAVVGSVAGAWAVATRVFFAGVDEQHERHL